MRREHAAPDGRQEEGGNSVKQGENQSPMCQKNRVLARKDEEKVQVDNRHEEGKEHERVDQGATNHNLRPVVSAHVSSDRHEAEHEEEPGGMVIGPFPEDPRAHGEDQQLLKKPDDRTRHKTAWADTGRRHGRTESPWSSGLPIGLQRPGPPDRSKPAWPGCNRNTSPLSVQSIRSE